MDAQRHETGLGISQKEGIEMKGKAPGTRRRTLKVFAVEHQLGASLFLAYNPSEALRLARQRFGTHAAPFTLPENQAEAIAAAKAFGAEVL